MTDERFDVVVVGLGAMGSMAAWRLAQRGARVLGVEQFTPGHDQGSSHGESRIIRTAYFEGAAYVPLAKRAWQGWQELERLTGESLLVPSGGLMVGTPDSAVVTGTLAAARAHDLPVRALDTGQLRAAHPNHVVADGIVAVEEEQAGVLRPEAGVRAGVRAAADAGAVIERSSVDLVEPDENGPRVVVGGHTVTARHVVVCAGAWTGRLLPPLAHVLRPVRRVMAWFGAEDPASYAPGRFGVFVRDDEGDRQWYGFPSMDGRTVKYALHHQSGLDETVDAAAGVRPPDDADAERLQPLTRRLAGLHPAPERLATCIYTMTADADFVVGAHRQLPGITVLAGFSGHGYKFAPSLGEVAADLALDGGTERDIALFDPQRFDAGPAVTAGP